MIMWDRVINKGDIMKKGVLMMLSLLFSISLVVIYAGTEIPIANTGTDEVEPAIDGSTIVYLLGPYGSLDIYGYNAGPDGIFGNADDYTFVISTNPEGYQQAPRINGKTVVWYDHRNGNYDIYGYDAGPDGIFGNGDDNEVQVTTDTSDQWFPDVQDRYIVWNDSRHGRWEIYGYDMGPDKRLGTADDVGEFRITNNQLSDDYNPEIYGNIVVYQKGTYPNGPWDLYGYDLSTSTEFLISNASGNQQDAAIYGNYVVWTDYRNGNGDIYGYNLSTSTEFPIVTESLSQITPAIDGNIVVWQDYRSGSMWDIYGYDLSTSTEFPIRTGISKSTEVDICNDVVTWIDWRKDKDIYALYISPPVTTPPTTPPVRANPIAAFIPVKNYHLRQVNTCLECIEENLPEDVPEDVQALLDEMQEHIDNANTTGNSIYANNELLKALKCAEDIQEKLGITCPL